MKQRIGYFFIVRYTVFAIVGLGMGYLIYQQQTGFIYSKKQKASSSQQLASLQENIKTPSSNVTYNEIDALKWPSPDASTEEKQRHADLVQKVAKRGEFLDLTKNCKIQPAVLRVKVGDTFTVRNNDQMKHAIEIDKKNVFSIPAAGVKKITVSRKIFPFGQGNYGYICDSKQGVAGIFFVSE